MFESFAKSAIEFQSLSVLWFQMSPDGLSFELWQHLELLTQRIHLYNILLG